MTGGGQHGRDLGMPSVPGQAGQEGRTRHEVARLLLERGPITAAAVAAQLGISPTAVRRHLDALHADGEAETRDASSRGRRGRGRPAKSFLLTDSGRARFGHAYDDLAVSAIRFLAEHGGKDAIRAFAEHRVAALVGPHREAILGVSDPEERALALAAALTREGYAASTQRIAGSGQREPMAGASAQLCQHHCPVAHVAAEFPQLCEAETAAFAELLGTHVQRLATIARGDAACTTHVPTDVQNPPRDDTAGSTKKGMPA
ncbi:MAG: helix-turn-helix domain-containing protein [Actinophytocola sp.]|nr:helix-turn-helix domain-containing protein [Actinophytocola sp.]